MDLEAILVDTGEHPSHCVIWLHGLGADGHDFEPIVPDLQLPIPVRYIFPHAPLRAVTLNAGMVMRAWYDIDPSAPASNADGLEHSIEQVQVLLEEQQQNGIRCENTVLAGFSQGGVIALEVALRYEQPFAGILALSTYLHDADHLVDRISLRSVDTPVFMAHGEFDPMIPITRAVSSRIALEQLQFQVEWHQYAMEHNVSMDEIQDIAAFLAKVLH